MRNPISDYKPTPVCSVSCVRRELEMQSEPQSQIFFTCGWNLTDTHNFTLQHRRVIRIMRYSPTLRHIPAPAVCTRTLAEGVHRGISDDPHNPDTLA